MCLYQIEKLKHPITALIYFFPIHLVSGDQNLFKINPETGEVRTVKGLDYEIQRMHFLTISTEEARGTFNLGMF